MVSKLATNPTTHSPPPSQDRKVKVAIVGSGLAGLTAAHLLSTRPTNQVGPGEHDDDYEVHIFEMAASLGMDSASILLSNSDRKNKEADSPEWRIDVPIRSFQGGYYTQVIALFEKIGATFQIEDFTYSFSALKPPTRSTTTTRSITTKLIYNGKSGRAGMGMPSMFKRPYEDLDKVDKLSTPSITLWVTKAHAFATFVVSAFFTVACFIRMLVLSMPILRYIPLLGFPNPVPSQSKVQRLSTMTFEEWADLTIPRNFLARWIGFDVIWMEFTETVLAPLFSGINTATMQDILNHPIEEILDYNWLTFGTHHYVLDHGVQGVVARLSANIDHIRVGVAVTSIQHDVTTNQATVEYVAASTDGAPTFSISGFDHVIFATQAPRAVPLLKTYLASLVSAIKSPEAERSVRKRIQVVQEQIDCLEKFVYREALVVNHTDSTLLPDDERDRRTLNLISADWRSEASHSLSEAGLETRDADVTLIGSNSKCNRATLGKTDNKRLSVSPVYAMNTHVLTRPKGFTRYPGGVFQSSNPIIPPRKDAVLSAMMSTRCILTLESKEAVRLLYEEEKPWWQVTGQGKTGLGRLQGGGWHPDNKEDGVNGPGIWFCGSYCYPAIPLLEGCVVSATNIVKQGIRLRKAAGSQS